MILEANTTRLNVPNIMNIGSSSFKLRSKRQQFWEDTMYKPET